MKKPILSKSKYLAGLQCPKLLWTLFNQPEIIPEDDASTLHIYEQGHEVGKLAQQLFPDGIHVEYDPNPANLTAKTKHALFKRKPLFEAGLLYNDTCYALPDILVPSGDDKWDIIEVKSGTGVHDHYIPDVAFQKYVYTGAGLKINRCYLMHINSDYIRNGDVDVAKLFAKADITKEVNRYLPTIEPDVQRRANA